MAKSSDIVGYSFKAETYCPQHIAEVITSTPEYEGWGLGKGVNMLAEDNLNAIAYHFQIDRDDESSFDTDEFPKIIPRDQAEGSVCGVDGKPLS